MSDVHAPPIDELIPHSGNSILLERVIAHDGETTTAQIRIASQQWLVQPTGAVASWMAIEYMAQCVAAHEGMVAKTHGLALPLGYLASVKSLRVRIPEFQPDDDLRVSTKRIGGRPGLGGLSHACAIHAHGTGPEDEPIAEGRLLVVIERVAREP